MDRALAAKDKTMTKFPRSIYFLLAGVLICLLLGFFGGNIRVWYGLAAVGVILIVAAIGKWVRDNEPPKSDEEKEQDNIDNQIW